LDSTAGIVTKLKEEMAEWKQKKAMALTEEKNTMMEKITKQLRLREDQKRYANQIKIVWGKLRSGGVSRVIYLDENGLIQESA
jgi:hypothetical protein